MNPMIDPLRMEEQWQKFLNQCHLVSDKVGNFHGNKALVTFL